MLHRTVAPSTSARRVSSPRMICTDLISSDLRKRPPARSTAIRPPRTSDSCCNQQLEHDAGVGAVGLQRRDGHGEVEGVASASARAAPSSLGASYRPTWWKTQRTRRARVLPSRGRSPQPDPVRRGGARR